MAKNDRGPNAQVRCVGMSAHTRLALAVLVCASTHASAVPRALHPDIEIRKVADFDRAVRIARDPRDQKLFVMDQSGRIGHLDPEAEEIEMLYSSRDHDVSGIIQGFAIGPDGTMYISSNQIGNSGNTASVTRGVAAASGERTWSVLARTEPIPTSGNLDHFVNALIVTPDNRYVLVNSGARTDHGEVEDNGGAYPGVREAGLTSIVWRLPLDAEDLVLPDDRDALRTAGYLYAEGVRNLFDMAYAPNGDLFGTENSSDRDVPEELNWMRQGHHYGFPWRLADQDNPERSADYDPALDPLVGRVSRRTERNDPDFPLPPDGIVFTDPVVSLGPDADSFRDPVTGELLDASDLGLTLSTFTAHRSPLGLVFDTEGVLIPEFRSDGFMLSWTEGDPQGNTKNGPFMDAGEDLVHLDLNKMEDRYQVSVTRIVDNFSGPVDAEMIGNRIYVVSTEELDVWEITLPRANDTVVEENLEATLPQLFFLAQNYPNPFNGGTVIRFDLSAGSQVELAVYNLAGQKVAALADGFRHAGSYSLHWDGRDTAGHRLGNGVYVYRLRAGALEESRRLVLLE